MSDKSLAEKSRNAMEGAVDELVGHDEVGGLVFLLKRSDGRDRKNALYAELLESIDVRAEIEF